MLSIARDSESRGIDTTPTLTYNHESKITNHTHVRHLNDTENDARQVKPFPAAYTLLPLPRYLAVALEKASCKAELDVSSERSLVRIIYEDLMQDGL